MFDPNPTADQAATIARIHHTVTQELAAAGITEENQPHRPNHRDEPTIADFTQCAAVQCLLEEDDDWLLDWIVAAPPLSVDLQDHVWYRVAYHAYGKTAHLSPATHHSTPSSKLTPPLYASNSKRTAKKDKPSSTTPPTRPPAQ